MKTAGFIRKTDNLGRIVIPKDIRDKLNFSDNESMEIFLDNEEVILKKYQHGCIFCRETENTIKYNTKLICENCIEEIAKEVK